MWVSVVVDSLLIVTPIVGFCYFSIFCCTLLCVYSSCAIISIGRRELVALLCLSSWCLVIVVGLFLTMPQVCLHFVIVVFHDHTHYFCTKMNLVHLCYYWDNAILTQIVIHSDNYLDCCKRAIGKSFDCFR